MGSRDIRQAILDESGHWALHVEADEGPLKLQAVAALRSILGLSIVEASALKTRLP